MSVGLRRRRDNARPARDRSLPPLATDSFAHPGRALALVGLLGIASVAASAPGRAATQGPGSASPAEVVPARVRLGIDVWAESGFAPLAGARVGLITNATGRSSDGTSTIEILYRDPRITLAAVLTPEHGLFARQEGQVGSGTEPRTGVPMYSLYGASRRPDDASLSGLDALVFDIQDVGARFYTYATTLAYSMEEAAARGIPVVVLDRPNPIGGVAVSGPVLDPDLRSFVGYASIPTRHGMTIGELARYFNEEGGIGTQLTVVPMQGWRRSMWWDETGLEWINPSPNIRNPTQALLYPTLGSLERTNISVGRGTDEPFQWFGAPWLDQRAVASELNRAQLPGIVFVPRRRTPRAPPYAGKPCAGVELIVTDRDAYRSGLTAATIAVVLQRLHPGQWDPRALPAQWGNRRILEQLAAHLSPEQIVASWQPELEQFVGRRARFLLYP